MLSSTSVSTIGGYTLGRTVGEGSFGKVKQGVHKLTGQEVAIKVVDKIHAPTVVREIETWRHLHHPNIAQLYEVITTENKIYMVMEFCHGGEAFDHIYKNGKLDDTQDTARRIFKQIVEAVGYCHELNFVHRDLKLENILLTDDLDVKVIDFGFTREYQERKLLETYCGSTAYAAPEMIMAEKYLGPQADIWSLGVILYTLLCGFLPFDDENDATVHRKILNVDYELPDFLSPDSSDLIQKILKRDPKDRFTIAEIVQHPWLAGI
ncbi:kinase-like domain-containing protein, partial [Cladochytrium replicatum]